MSKKLEEKVAKLRAEYAKIQGRDPNKEIKPKVIFHKSKHESAFSATGSIAAESIVNDFWK